MISNIKQDNQQQEILDFIKFNQGMTSKEIAQNFHYEVSSSCARISEMVDKGLLVYGNRRKCLITNGFSQEVFLLTEQNKHLRKEKSDNTLKGEYSVEQVEFSLLLAKFIQDKKIPEIIKIEFIRKYHKNEDKITEYKQELENKITVYSLVSKYNK